GCSKGVEGPNLQPNACGNIDNTTIFGTPGDPALSAIVGASTFDAAILEFDFVPQFSTVTFRYVFSSEEYNGFVNQPFNDVFAFFINGKNCALLPGSNAPVSINTINNGNPFPGEDPTPHNPEFFRNNARVPPANLAPTINTEMDGLTVVLIC